MIGIRSFARRILAHIDRSDAMRSAHRQARTARDRMATTVAESTETLERLLLDNILPFWYPGVLDLDHGGYRINHDIHGRWKGPANKGLVTQARTLWFFSRLSRSTFGKPEHLAAATHGYRFLIDRMWDPADGGLYWEVDAAGDPTLPGKHLYGQAFGLYALSEYAATSGDQKARQRASELFDVIETRAHDRKHGGYRESFTQDWAVSPPASRSYLGTEATVKTLNTHLHLLEAVASFYRLSGDAVAKERLGELLLALSNTVVFKPLGVGTDGFRRDWERLRGDRYDRASYGHDVESVWLLIDACRAAGLSPSLVRELCERAFRNSVRYGFDRKAGGFYYSGPFDAPADQKDKVWWVQAEGLLGALHLHRLTGADEYWDCFVKTLGWIVTYQADWQHGEWHERITADGRPAGDKAGPWKGPYHNGRAVLDALQLLRSPHPSARHDAGEDGDDGAEPPAGHVHRSLGRSVP